MKKAIILIIFILIFYVFLFFISKNINKNYLIGFGWKVYLKESETYNKKIKIGELKENEEIFIKNIKIYPKVYCFLSYELVKELTNINLDSPFSDFIKIISKKSGDVYLNVQFEEKRYDFINYVFGFPIRIDEIKINIPINILEILVE
ncbi:MAG: hypothetical protein N3D74_01785 [Caldisericia bacterium]|nr:hypothetical protein [Caldisericia bacterium]